VLDLGATVLLYYLRLRARVWGQDIVRELIGSVKPDVHAGRDTREA
jgi:hypothetical protein